MPDGRALRIWTLIAHQSQGSPVSVVHVCAAVIGCVDVNGAALTVMASPTVRDNIHATDAVAAALEEQQLTLGQGPCVDAFTLGGPVLASDLRTSAYRTRWPAFTPAAIDHGARAVFALPLQIGAIQLGTLALYRTRAVGLDPAELADALAFAETAGTMLLGTAAGIPPDLAELAWQREDPTARQAQVHQATGMIIAQLGVGPESAFARLRAYAYARDRPLGEVARDVIERRLRFDTDPPAVSPP